MEDPKTRRDLIDQVLDNLGVLVPGQAPAAEAVQRIDNLLDPVFASLRTRSIVYVQDPGTVGSSSDGEIPAEIFLALADCVAFRVAGAFNLAGDASLKALSNLAEDELRVVGKPARTRRMLRTDPQLRSSRRNIPGNFTRGT
jgi:hypothetical protein